MLLELRGRIQWMWCSARTRSPETHFVGAPVRQAKGLGLCTFAKHITMDKGAMSLFCLPGALHHFITAT